MAVQSPLSPDKVLARIDAIMQELADLRRAVAAQQLASERAGDGLTQQLYGSLGQGSWEEWESDLDWQRFDR